ncbi:MAG: mechanosensitive ion channel [Oscillospiraceae bacterium]|nr:mechanosensitive ion channel [Oscillospiraceae bacterium]
MNKPIRKLIISLVLSSVLVGVLVIGYTVFNAMAGAANDREAEMKIEGFTLTLSNLMDADMNASSDLGTRILANMNLLSLPLNMKVESEGDGAIRKYNDCCVVRKDADRLILPEDDSGIPILKAVEYADAPLVFAPCTPFEDINGAFWARMKDSEGGEYMLCVYRRLEKGYYGVYYMPASEVKDFLDSRVDIEGVLRSAESAYEAYFLVGTEKEDGDIELIFISDIFEEYANDTRRSSSLGITVNDNVKAFKNTTVGQNAYLYYISDPVSVSYIGEDLRIVYIVPLEGYVNNSVTNGWVLFVVPAAIFLVLTVLVVAAIRMIRQQIITESQRKRYSAFRMRMTAVALGFAGFVLILLMSMFLDSVSRLYAVTNNCESALETINSMIDESILSSENIVKENDALRLDYVQRAAGLLEDYPELKTPESLRQMSQIIGADYLMLYDDHGNELLSDSRYIGLSFGEKESSSTHEFRKLITGVPSIVHQPCEDEATGLYRQLIGVSMDDGDISDGYASLIAAYMQDKSRSLITEAEIMSSMGTSSTRVFSVDKESRTVVISTDADMQGRDAVELGLKEKSIHGSFRDFFTLDQIKWFGCSVERDGLVYYYAVREDSIFTGIITTGILRAVLFLIAYVLLAVVVLYGYTEKNIDDMGARVIDDRDWLATVSTEAEKSGKTRVAGILSGIDGWWGQKSPGKKAWFVLEWVVGITLIMMIATVRSVDNNKESNLVTYVLNGDWTFGFNLFALTRIIIIVLGLVLLLLFFNVVFGVLSGVLDTRGKTICTLIDSLLTYVLIIAALYFSLESLGFNTKTLLDALGIFSLAISLGAKDLVADVLSGIIIVFSGEYKIGEIVEIAGFRGRVWDIGVRSTTLVNDDGNVKNISNRSIANVLNLSRMNSRCTMQLTVGNDQSIENIEEMLARELPALGSSIPEIIKGPDYVGVTAVSGGSSTLTFSAECREENLGAARAKMNVAVNRLFERYEIPVK